MNFRPSQNSSPKEVREIPTTSHNTGGSGGGRGPGSQNGSCHDILKLWTQSLRKTTIRSAPHMTASTHADLGRMPTMKSDEKQCSNNATTAAPCLKTAVDQEPKPISGGCSLKSNEKQCSNNATTAAPCLKAADYQAPTLISGGCQH